MKKRHLVEYEFDVNDILTALQVKHPEIRRDAVIRVIHRPGTGPGHVKNSKGVSTYPIVRVTTKVPDPARKESP